MKQSVADEQAKESAEEVPAGPAEYIIPLPEHAQEIGQAYANMQQAGAVHAKVTEAASLLRKIPLEVSEAEVRAAKSGFVAAAAEAMANMGVRPKEYGVEMTPQGPVFKRR
jgi:hypothetical protein